MKINTVTEIIIGKAIEVHKGLGPGLLESVYEACLKHELVQSCLKVERQKPLYLNYKGVLIDCSYRMDLVVEDSVIIELKTVESILPIHASQMLSYLRISGLKVGLLINFNVEKLTHGIRRIVNKL